MWKMTLFLMLKKNTSLKFNRRRFHHVKSSRIQIDIFFFICFETFRENETIKSHIRRRKIVFRRTIWVQKKRKSTNNCMFSRIIDASFNVSLIRLIAFFNLFSNSRTMNDSESISISKTIIFVLQTSLKSFREISRTFVTSI
jgi:hypothetical protein